MQWKLDFTDDYDWQNRFRRTTTRHRLAVVSRRAGKTRTGARIVAQQIVKPRQKILWVAPAHKQLPENYQQVLETLGPLVKKSLNNEQIVTVNNSIINFEQSANHAALRGKGYTLVLFDEMAFAEEKAWAVLRPTLADHGTGRLVGLTTPNGVSGWFYNLFTRAKEDPAEWYVIQKPWNCSPHLLPVEMEKLKKEIGETRFNQEMLAIFQSVEGARFRHEWLQNIMVDEIPEAFHRSTLAVDLSLGRYKTSDYQALVFGGLVNDIIWVDAVQEQLPLGILGERLRLMYQQYKPELLWFEANGDQLVDANSMLEKWPSRPIVHFDYSTMKKETRIERLAPFLESGKIRIKKSPGGNLLWKQLSEFPMAKMVREGGVGDDGPDALEFIVRSFSF